MLKFKKETTEKLISDGKEMNENMNDTEREYASVEDSLNIHRSALTLVSEIPNIIMSQMLSHFTRARKNTSFNLK